MKIDITELKTNKKNSIDIDNKVLISKEQILSKEILELKNLVITGTLDKYERDIYEINCSLSGIMILRDSLTLNPIDYPFETEIEGNLEELFSEIGEIVKKSENSIDIFPIIWENILMEIPIRYSLEENVLTSGDGWKIVTDEDAVEPNPELKKLEELIEQSEVL